MMLAAGWIFWFLLLYALSVLSGTGLLQLLLAVYLPLVLISFAAVCTASRHFSVTFPMETAGAKGGEIPFSIFAENKSALPLPRISCRITGVNLLTGESFHQKADFSIGRGESRTIPCSLTSKYCGRLELTIRQVRIYDYFGLLYLPLRTERHIGVTVMPNTFEMELLAPICKSIPDDSDEYSTLRAGNDPTEIFQVREYRPGDSLRQIHWKLTQKFDQLMTREASLPVDQSVMVLFDTHSFQDKPSPTLFDAAAEVLATLSQSLLEDGISHRIVWRDAATGGISSAFISSTEDLTETLGQLLARGEDDGVSVLDVLIMEKGNPDASHLFAVCAAAPCVPDASMECACTVLCGREAGGGETDGVLYFGGETYAEDLAALIV